MVSRRRVLALGLLGSAGFWTASSNQFAARFMREIVANTTRGVKPARHRPDPTHWPSDALTACWLGHSTVLINFYGVNILTDPVLFPRVGADVKLGTIGPKRLIAPALHVRELPSIDLVLLSHAHMDHFDLPTLRSFAASTHVVTASETSDLLRRTRMHAPRELCWGEKARVNTRHGIVEVKAFEVKHWGARWRHDTYRGYNGYVVSRHGRQIIFGGDTAMTTSFKGLHHVKPYALAIMPIGAYHPWEKNHCTPEQAVQMADHAGAEFFLPVHHQTFPLGRERRSEPMERLEAALNPDRLGWREVGETFCIS